MLNKLKENKNLILLLGIAFFAGFLSGAGRITDYDFWFHYSAGEYFAETGMVPNTPIWSWYGLQEGLSWISHEWLFGVIIYYICEWFGIVGVYLFAPLMLGTVLMLTVFLFRKELMRNYVLSIIGIALAGQILGMGSASRPQLFAYMMTIFLFYVLKKDAEKDSKIIYALPVLTILWTNIHGGSYMLIHGFLLISLLVHLFDFRLGKIVFEKHSKNRSIRRLLVLLACIIVIPLNAHGLDMVFYPVSNLGDKLMQSTIMEWFSPDLKDPAHVKIYVMMALGICSLVSTKKDIKAIDMLTMFAYIFLTARSFRFCIQMTLVILPIALTYADSVDEWLKLTKDKLITILLGSLLFMYSIASLATVMNTIDEPINYNVFPSDEILEVVKETNPDKLLNGYNEGGYLIYKDIKVFIDGRADIYSRYNLKDYMNIVNFKINSLELIEKYGFDYILLNKAYPLCGYMKLSDAFMLVAEDENFVFYKIIGNVNKIKAE